MKPRRIIWYKCRSMTSQMLILADSHELSYSFLDFHNAYIAILDPAYHTQAYLLGHPILETAICAAASQAYDPDNFSILMTRLNYMFGKAFERGDLDVTICQALSIASVWKDVKDSGSYLRVGHAIR